MKYSGQYKVKNHTKLLEPEAKKLRIFTSILLTNNLENWQKLFSSIYKIYCKKKHDLKIILINENQ